MYDQALLAKNESKPCSLTRSQIGGDSGAYLNPALTLSQAIYRGFSFRKIPIYFLAQFLGGFGMSRHVIVLSSVSCMNANNPSAVGALLTYANYVAAIDFYAGDGVRTVPPTQGSTAQIFVTFPQSFLPIASAFFSEVFATALLTLSVFALKDDTSNGGIARAADNWFPLKMYFIYNAIGVAYGWETAFATNPARDFGPRVACTILGYGSGLWTNAHYYFWMPLVAPFVGAMIGGYEPLLKTLAKNVLGSTLTCSSFVYDFFVYTGASPVNGPWLGAGLLFSRREESKNRSARQEEWEQLPEHTPLHGGAS